MSGLGFEMEIYLFASCLMVATPLEHLFGFEGKVLA
jgi:hypothetical protein